MQDVFGAFVEFIQSLLLPLGLGAFAQIIAIIPLLLLLYVIYLIVMRTVTLTFRKVGMGAEATSGIKLMLRLLFFAVALMTVLSATTFIPDTTLLTGGALFGTAIGLAFSKALSNMVSGFYVLGARPFRVGDYVRIGDIEGIVLEITLNYTRLLQADYTKEYVPNSKVVDSQVTNYRIRIDDYMKERGKEYQSDTPKANLVRAAFGGLRELTKGTEVFRYSFELNVHKDYDIAMVDAYFEEVCEKWKDEFIDKPEVLFWSEGMFGIVYKVVYIVKDPMDILGKGSDFTHEMSRFHYGAKVS
ncbi:MAG: mechanosensitive ion channel [Candidatus Thorarchaeota archaeon]|nr:MAG: mechanosensitive ion channel [Candidatus Thorarchaeota archaeon]